jgi:lipid II:glycine glycyltransferase (peptidoglycan interpeptide bridge formation enzyme)
MLDQNRWNEFVRRNAPRSGAFLQSFEWGEFQRSLGYKIVRHEIAAREVTALVQAFVRRLPLGQKTLYIPRGPIASDQGIEIIADLQKKAVEQGALAVRVDPAEPLGIPQARPAKPLQPQTTLILDLSKNEEELLLAMHEKTRYNIRLAERRGVAFHAGQEELFENFWSLLSQTAERDRFQTHSKKYYSEMIKILGAGNLTPNRARAEILLAKHENAPLAGMIIVYFGDTATYIHGASATEKRNLMAPCLLHWRAIERAKSFGCKNYDFWGIAPANAEKHPLQGVTRFKRGFGGVEWRAPDSFELPIQKFRYKIYAAVQKLRNL